MFHSFHVSFMFHFSCEISLHCILFMLRFFRIALFLCVVISMMNFFRAALFSCHTFSILTWFMFHFFHAALFPCCTISLLLFLFCNFCCTFFVFHFFMLHCNAWIFLKQVLRNKNLEQLHLFHALFKKCYLEFLLKHTAKYLKFLFLFQTPRWKVNV